ncbi:MAG: isoprenylcysteine carboxylmethyltransferase family protein [Ignavibacteriales bacterium CG07_land_8_20_14_0_80_59_12]|nr:MAG: isoprenylcysteine carboxylmethyltransferase family protein [Ignavibacteriales bacterium CG07_land_8_20_14_0_80_59_12]
MDLRSVLFKNRSYTPIPFLVAMVILARPAVWSVAAGLAVSMAGELLRFLGVSYAGSETRTTKIGATRLVTNGPFSRVRNPLYLGNILIYLGLSIMANAWLPWIALVVVVWFVFQYALIVSLEEEFLKQKFGAEYIAYMNRVPRFLPRLAGAGPAPNSTVTFSPKRGLASEGRTLQALALVVGVILILWYVR